MSEHETEPETGSNNGNVTRRLRQVGVILGAIVAVAGGAFSVFQLDPLRASGSTALEREADRLAALEVTVAVQSHRINALEADASESVPIALLAKGRIDALEEAVRENTRRLDRLIEGGVRR